MKKTKYQLIVLTFLLILTQFTISLLTNYASSTIPTFLKDYPYIVWILIFISVLSLIILTIFHQNSMQVTEDQQPQQSQPYKPANRNGGKKDIYISHSKSDDKWVHDVMVPKLKSHGFSVMTNRDFLAGGFKQDQMEDVIKDSKRVLAVFTKNYFLEDWSTLENIMTQFLDPAAKARKLIPVLREACDIPLRLAGLHYRDLRNENDREWDKLMQDLM